MSTARIAELQAKIDATNAGIARSKRQISDALAAGYTAAANRAKLQLIDQNHTLARLGGQMVRAQEAVRMEREEAFA